MFSKVPLGSPRGGMTRCRGKLPDLAYRCFLEANLQERDLGYEQTTSGCSDPDRSRLFGSVESREGLVEISIALAGPEEQRGKFFIREDPVRAI